MPPSSSELRLAASCLLAFAAFLHYDELEKLRCCDIVFLESSMSIHISSSKTNQYQQGDSVMMERYFAQAQLSCSSTLLLFRGLTHTKHGERLRATGGLSYTCMRELFITNLRNLDYDATKFGLYSLRAGGAMAAANAGVPDRLFKRHGL